MSKESVQYQEALVYAQSRDYFKKLRYIPEQATRRYRQYNRAQYSLDTLIYTILNAKGV